jgi:PncC family amidohydrolase
MEHKKSNQELANDLVLQLIRVKKKITTVESCSGGLLSSFITSVPGSSATFGVGFVTYSDWAKNQLIDVDYLLLNGYGAVSNEVAKAMAEGALIKSEADLALSITGFAGPTGDKIGLVFIGLASNLDKQGMQSKSYEFNMAGTRDEIREEACYEAMMLALNLLSE